MKTKIIVVGLAVVCLGLAIALFATKKQADDQHRKDVDAANDFSKQLVGATAHLDELRQVNLQLTNDLAASQQQAAQLSNTMALANTTLEQTKTSLAGAQTQIATLNTKIAALETQNTALDQQASELAGTIAKLNATIEDTQNRLAVSETNRVFLEQELKKAMAQRAELERKFNDLGELRAQVSKIREEMFVARRLQLMNNDNTGKKGAELLIQRTPPAATPAAPAANSDLNVEVGSDGSVKVIPPLDNKK